MRRAFTLLELVIILLIVGILMSFGIKLFGTFIKNDKYHKTEIILDNARDSLVGFLMSNGYLPCPDADDDGQADGSGGSCLCTWPNCYLPDVTLGVSALDAYRYRLYYQVDNNFTSFTSLRGFCVHAPYLTPSITVTDGNHSYNVVAVLISAGLTDADHDGKKLDGLNSEGTNFVMSSVKESSNYDDIVRELYKQTLISEVCEPNLRRIKVVITNDYLCYHGKTHDSSDGVIFIAPGDVIQEHYCGYSSGGC